MNQEQMTDEQAMQLLSQLCASYKGNLAEHELLQQALGLVGSKVFPVPMPTTEVPVPNKIAKKSKKKSGPKIVKPDFKKGKTGTVAE